MVINGFHVDSEGIDALLTKTDCELGDATYALRKEFNLGKDFNFNSPAQILNLLRRSIPQIKTTGAQELSKYEKDFPFIEKLLKIRDLEKLGGTGLEGLKEYIDSNELVHSSYSVHGAETGRSSSSAPNLQNTDPRVRPFFISRYKDGKLLHTDLSGIEYRLIAHASQDKELLRIFNSGEDIHDNAYRKIYGEWPPDKARRKLGKTANFLGVYGGGYKKFLFSTGLEDCGESRAAFKVVSGMYPGVEKWKHNIENQLFRRGFICSLFGRIRHFESVTQDDIREAINWIIQSSGHDILKIYSMEMCDRLREAGLHRTLLVSEVHDSNTFDSPQDEWENAVKIITPLAKDLNPLILHYLGEKMTLPIVAEVEAMEHWA
jgi:DNA polymerase-1